MDLFNLFAKISIDDKDYNSKISNAQSKFQKVGQTLGGLNKTFLGIGTAIGGVAGIASKFGMDFEAQMSKVGAISGASGKDIEDLTSKAKEMGRTTKFSATESGQAFEYMAMAGWKTGEMLEGIEGVMNLASASGEDLALVSDIVTDSMTAFGLSANESARFADVLAVASSNSNTNVAMLGESFKYVAPLAGSMGYSIEDTSKALGLMANAGIKGSMSGTALKTMLVNLAKPTSSMRDAMDELGISLTNTDGTMKTLDEVMLNLREAFGDLNQEQQAQYGATIAGKEALAGLLSIVNASDADFNKLQSAIDGAEGTAKKMADTMNDNLKGSFTILGSTLEGLALAFYDKFSKPLKKAVDSVTETISKVTEKLASGELDNLLSGIAGTIAGIGVALLTLNVAYVIRDLINVFNGLNAVTKIGTAVQGAFNLVMSMNPFGLIAIAIAGVVTAIGVFIATNENAREKIASIWEAIKGFFINTMNSVISFFTQTIPNFIKNIIAWFNQLPEFISQMWSNFKDICVTMFNSIISFFTETIPNLVKNIITWFGELPYKIGFILGELLGKIIKWGADTVKFVVTEVPKIISNIVKFFAELPGKVWTWLANTVQKVVQWGAEMLSKGTTATINFVSNVVKFIAELPSKIWTWLGNTVQKVVQWGGDMVRTGVNAMKQFGSSVVEAISDLPSKFMEIGVNMIKGVWNGITSMGSWIADKISGFFGGIVDGAKKALDIHSPSRVMKREVGVYMAQGVGVGFEEEMENVNDIVQASLGKVVVDSANVVKSNEGEVIQGGVTINQYYNKPIDEVESARLTRNEMRKLAIGVI